MKFGQISIHLLNFIKFSEYGTRRSATSSASRVRAFLSPATHKHILHFHQKTIEGFYNEAVIEMLSNKKIHSSQFPQFEIQNPGPYGAATESVVHHHQQDHQ